MRNYQTIITEKKGSVQWVYLNRADVHNALNDIMINELFEEFTALNNDDCRVIVLTGNGKSFCAGADLGWMKSVINYSFDQNLAESEKLAALLNLIFNHPKPVIAKVNGPAYGGGVGLLSACDIAVGNDKAKFAFTEVRLGIVPSVISPYIIYRTNINKAKELFLTGEVFTAAEALNYGILNCISSAEEIDNIIEIKCNLLKGNGPEALRYAKELVKNNIALNPEELASYTSNLIASLRISEEGQDGMNSFLEKRLPKWKKD